LKRAAVSFVEESDDESTTTLVGMEKMPTHTWYDF